MSIAYFLIGILAGLLTHLAYYTVTDYLRLRRWRKADLQRKLEAQRRSQSMSLDDWLHEITAIYPSIRGSAE